MQNQRVEAVWRAQNDVLDVEWRSDASMTVRVRATGAEWRAGRVAIQETGTVDVGHVWIRTERSSCEQYPGRFRVTKQGDRFEVEVFDQLNERVGAFRCRWILEGPWLRFVLLDGDDALPSLIFPTPFHAASLVVPNGIGRWYRKPLAKRLVHRFNILSMRWFGGLAAGDDDGYLGIFTDAYQDAGISLHNTHISPLWFRSMGKLTGPRTVSYRFTTGGYVGLAKAFREWCIGKGIHKPLAEKIRENPNAKAMLGGRELGFFLARTQKRSRFEDKLQFPPAELAEHDEPALKVNFTYVQVRDAMEEAKRLGWRRGTTKLRGWIAGGYDETHPDIWPPVPELGSVDEFRELMSMRGDIVGGLHDNYGDIYPHVPSFPNGVVRNADGSLMRGGYWSGGQCYIINGRDALGYLKRNWEHLQTLNIGKFYCDTLTAMYLYESYEKGNETTRVQDEGYKQEMMRFFKSKGVLLASEETSDFGVPYLDSSDNSHTRVISDEFVTIPLWPLVFHDAVFCGRHGAGPNAETGAKPWWLTQMLWSYYGIWEWPQNPSESWKREFAETFFVEKWHARTGLAEMTTHRFLTPDCQVEQTQFSSGQAITVNFAGEPREVEGKTIPPNTYLLSE